MKKLDKQGALICKEGTFLKIIKLEKRRGSNSIVIIITFSRYPDGGIILKIFEDLRQMLRIDDIISRKNKNIILLIKNVTTKEVYSIIKRFKKYFKLKYPHIKPLYIQKKVSNM